MPPLVSLLIPNFDGAACLKECLDSLLCQTYPSVEIIVVDNASTDESRDVLRSYENRIQTLLLDENRGFGAALNAGLQKASGEWVALFNNDAVADKDWLAQIMEAAASEETHGMAACKIVEHDDPRILDNTGHLLFGDGMNRGRGHGDLDLGQFDYETEALFPSGAACLLKKEMLDQIGGFDESFFAYGDDTELGLRARLAGWTCAYAPKARAVHHGSLTLGKFSVEKFFLVERNRLWVLLKYFPWPLILTSPAFTMWRFLLQGLAVVFRKGATGEAAKGTSAFILLWTLLKANAAGLRGIPKMLANRRRYAKAFPQKRRMVYRFLRKEGISAWTLAFRK